MQLTTQKMSDALIVDMPARMVFANAESLKVALVSMCDGTYKAVGVDLSAVEFVDSSGLAVLVAAYKKMQKKGGIVALISPTTSVRLLIEMTRLHQVFGVYDNSRAFVSAVTLQQ